jgi:hypothetical protein
MASRNCFAARDFVINLRDTENMRMSAKLIYNGRLAAMVDLLTDEDAG